MTTVLAGSAVVGRADADSVVFDRGRITAVGRALDLAEPGATFERVTGVIAAGVRDAHIHPSGYAAAVTGLSIGDATDLAELGERIFETALSLPPGVPVVASRLDEHRLAETRLPTAADLDRILANRPIMAIRYCGHVAVASTSALRRAGIGASTPNPPGGTIERGPDGRPTGVLRETAVGLVSSALATEVPSPGPERLAQAVAGLTGLGITRIDAIVSAGNAMWCGAGNELDDLIEIAPAVPIPMDVFVAASTPAELIDAAERLRAAAGAIRWAGWKCFADGSLGGLTAAMERPFSDHPGTGIVRLDPRSASGLAELTLDMGGTVAIHAIGDRANRMVLDVFRSLKGGWADPTRFRVEHASVLSEGLIADFASAGVTASVQPAFIRSEVEWLGARLGHDRVRWTYPFRSLLDAKVPVIAGSDSPVEDPNPWAAMAAACDNPITREESIDRASALAVYGSGTPRVGASADLVVLDRNPLTTDDLAGTRVQATYVNGVQSLHPTLPWPG